MPTVPVYSQRQVQDKALAAPEASFNTDVSSGVRALGETVNKIANDYVDREAETQANKVDTEVTAGWLKWDSENRQKYQGEKIDEYRQAAEDWWRNAAAQYAGSAGPFAKERIGKDLARKQNAALAGVYSYVDQRKEQHADAQAEASAQTTIEMGVDTGDVVGAADRVRSIVAGMGARKGWTTEQTQAATAAKLGVLHLTWLTQLADNGKADDATRYYDEHKGEIPATAQPKVEQMLKSAANNQFAEKFSAERSTKPLAQTLEEAAQIADPERRKAVLARVKEDHALLLAAQKEREQNAADQAWQLVGRGQRVPESVLMQMDGRERVQLQEHLADRARLLAERARGDVKVKTDWATYEDISSRIAAGENVRVAAYTTKIAPNDMEKLIDLKNRIANPKEAAEAVSTEQQLRSTIEGLKLSGSRAEEKRGKFRAAAQDLFNEHLQRTGKKPTFDERQQMLDKLTAEVVLERRDWWFDKTGPAYELPRDQLRQTVGVQSPAPAKFQVGKVYRDAKGNRAIYQADGTWKPAP